MGEMSTLYVELRMYHYHVESHLILYDELPCNVLTNLSSIVQLLAVHLDVVHTFPLVDDEDLVGVSEP